MADILLVEDYEPTHYAFATLFRHHGHQVRVSTGVDDALSQLRARRPDVLLLDLLMPGGGLRVLRHARGTPAFKDLPVLLVTTLESGPEVHEAQTLGVQGHHVKGLSPLPTLLDRLSQFEPHASAEPARSAAAK